VIVRFGFHGDRELAPLGRAAGYDYLESSVPDTLAPLESRDVFDEHLKTLKSSPLPCLVVNRLLSRSQKIVGPDVDAGALADYASLTMQRAEEAGVAVIVLGSRRSRNIPEGFDRRVAGEQLLAFGAMAAEAASQHGVTIVLEPLDPRKCNVLNSVGECAAFVRTVAHPSFRLLVDSYHFFNGADRLEDLSSNVGLLGHVHVSTTPGRLAPGAEPCDALQTLLATVIQGGYRGTISVEAKLAQPSVELPRALDLMRAWTSVPSDAEAP
jgi:sugar phosphate isomerase/epimerase